MHSNKSQDERRIIPGFDGGKVRLLFLESDPMSSFSPTVIGFFGDGCNIVGIGNFFKKLGTLFSFSEAVHGEP
jgi:hypothetical protein